MKFKDGVLVDTVNALMLPVKFAWLPLPPMLTNGLLSSLAAPTNFPQSPYSKALAAIIASSSDVTALSCPPDHVLAWPSLWPWPGLTPWESRNLYSDCWEPSDTTPGMWEVNPSEANWLRWAEMEDAYMWLLTPSQPHPWLFPHRMFPSPPADNGTTEQ